MTRCDVVRVGQVDDLEAIVELAAIADDDSAFLVPGANQRVAEFRTDASRFTCRYREWFSRCHI